MSGLNSFLGCLFVVVCVLVSQAPSANAQAYIIHAPSSYTTTYGSIGTHSYGYSLGPSYVAHYPYIPRYSVPLLIKK